jgi:hypothetical protein
MGLHMNERKAGKRETRGERHKAGKKEKGLMLDQYVWTLHPVPRPRPPMGPPMRGMGTHTLSRGGEGGAAMPRKRLPWNNTGGPCCSSRQDPNVV